MNIEDLVMVNLYGEGYYSGNSDSHSMVISLSFYEKYEDEINNYTPYFHELDGKHSYVEGETSATLISEGTLKCVISSVLEDESWKIEESLFENIGAGAEEIAEQVSIHSDFSTLCDKKTVTKFYFKGEEI